MLAQRTVVGAPVAAAFHDGAEVRPELDRQQRRLVRPVLEDPPLARAGARPCRSGTRRSARRASAGARGRRSRSSRAARRSAGGSSPRRRPRRRAGTAPRSPGGRRSGANRRQALGHAPLHAGTAQARSIGFAGGRGRDRHAAPTLPRLAHRARRHGDDRPRGYPRAGARCRPRGRRGLLLHGQCRCALRRAPARRLAGRDQVPQAGRGRRLFRGDAPRSIGARGRRVSGAAAARPGGKRHAGGMARRRGVPRRARSRGATRAWRESSCASMGSRPGSACVLAARSSRSAPSPCGRCRTTRSSTSRRRTKARSGSTRSRDRAKRLRETCDGPEVVGHTDWSAKHLRFDERLQPTALYDWDSLDTQPEPLLVGTAAGSFTYTEELEHEVFPWPSVEESLSFLDEYESARGTRFSQVERRAAEGACLYLRAYAARCGHAVGDDVRHASLAELADAVLSSPGRRLNQFESARCRLREDRAISARARGTRAGRSA